MKYENMKNTMFSKDDFIHILIYLPMLNVLGFFIFFLFFYFFFLIKQLNLHQSV